MTHIQFITGGAPIPAEVIAQYGGEVTFSEDVPDWHLMPPMPANPTPGPGFQALPEGVQQVLLKAMSASISQATGRTVTIG